MAMREKCCWKLKFEKQLYPNKRHVDILYNSWKGQNKFSSKMMMQWKHSDGHCSPTITQKYEQSYNSKAMNSKSQIAFGNNKEVLSNKTEMQVSLYQRLRLGLLL